MDTDFEKLDPQEQARIMELARKKYNEYHKQWRDRNPEKVKQYRMRSFIKKAMEDGGENG